MSKCVLCESELTDIKYITELTNASYYKCDTCSIDKENIMVYSAVTNHIAIQINSIHCLMNLKGSYYLEANNEEVLQSQLSSDCFNDDKLDVEKIAMSMLNIVMLS